MEDFMCLTTAKALCLWYSHISLSQLTPEWQALVRNTNSTDSQKYTFSYNMFISTTLLFTTLANLTLPPSISWSSVTVATFMPLPRPFNSHAYPTNSCSTKLSRDSYIHTFLLTSLLVKLHVLDSHCPGVLDDPEHGSVPLGLSTVVWRLLRSDGVYIVPRLSTGAS